MILKQESNNEFTPADRARDSICDQFEQAWHQNPGYRVEDHLRFIPSIAQRFGVDGEKPKFKIAVVSELIRIEISLRRDANQSVFRFEYERRFPELESLIQEEFGESESQNIVATMTYTTGMKAKDLALAKAQPDNREEKVPHELGRFKKIVKIGSGGFGVVCRAVDSQKNQPVALKFPAKKRAGEQEETRSVSHRSGSSDETGSSGNCQNLRHRTLQRLSRHCDAIVAEVI